VFLLALLVFLCGKLLLTPIWRPLDEWEISHVNWSISGHPALIQYGWPWVFTERSTRFGEEPDYSEFSSWVLARDVAALLACMIVAALLLGRHHRRRGRWLSISLRELFALTTAVACAAGFWMYHVRLQPREGKAFADLCPGVSVSSEAEYCGPQSLRRLLPEDFLWPFMHVTRISFRGYFSSPGLTEERDAALATLRGLPYVRLLEFSPGDFEGLLGLPFVHERMWSHTATTTHPNSLSVTPPEAPDPAWTSTVDVSPIEQAEEIDFQEYFVDDDVLAVLARLPRLKSLRGGGVLLTDRGIDRLMRRDSLERLDLHLTSITDACVAQLAQSTRLRVLLLGSTQITDVALANLANLPTLEELDIRQCRKITEQGVKELLNAPNLQYLSITTPEEISPQTVVLLNHRIPHVSIGSP
jgi:hypothetical protein